MSQATYEKDEDWYILAIVPWYQGFYSQWENFEDAREGLIDAIEWVIYLKLKAWDKILVKQIEDFNKKYFQKESDLVCA